MGSEYNNTHKGIEINISPTYTLEEIGTINKCIEEAIKKIPENIMKHLKINNFEINVVSKRFLNKEIHLKFDGITKREIIKEEFKSITKSNRRGYYIWGTCCIYVMLYKEKEKLILHEKMEKLILHEIGHFLDYIGKSPLAYEEIKKLRKEDKEISIVIEKDIKPFRKSCNNIFSEIYECEKKGYSVTDSHYKNKYSEHFAESFSRKLMKDSKCINEFPKTIEYIEEFIKDFKPIKITI